MVTNELAVSVELPGCLTDFSRVLGSCLSVPQNSFLFCLGQGERHDPLTIATGVHYIPDPNKSSPLGEDGNFVSDSCGAFGVADGVGGCELVGIDSGIFARQLMESARRAAEVEGIRDAGKLIARCKTMSTALGASTISVAILDKDKALLNAAVLGDSAIMVIRGGRVAFKSKDQLRGFNFPYQLGNGHNGRYNVPSEACRVSIPVQEGDIVVLATDGLWDNLFDEEILKITSEERNSDAPAALAVPLPKRLAKRLAVTAHSLAADSTRLSPFAVKARNERWAEYTGGKMDDITVIVALLLPKEDPKEHLKLHRKGHPNLPTKPAAVSMSVVLQGTAHGDFVAKPRSLPPTPRSSRQNLSVVPVEIQIQIPDDASSVARMHDVRKAG